MQRPLGRNDKLSEKIDDWYDFIACKYVLGTDTRLCHLLLHRGGKVKAGCNCLLPYVQKLVAMQCNELGFRKLLGYYAKSSKDTNSECKASLHEVRCHLRKTYVFQRDLTVFGTNLSKLVLFGESQRDLDGKLSGNIVLLV